MEGLFYCGGCFFWKGGGAARGWVLCAGYQEGIERKQGRKGGREPGEGREIGREGEPKERKGEGGRGGSGKERYRSMAAVRYTDNWKEGRRAMYVSRTLCRRL